MNPPLTITLPPHTDGAAAEEIELTGHKRTIVIGANGAGKTRFAHAMTQALGAHAMKLSAIDALFTPTAAVPDSDVIDRLFIDSPIPSHEKQRVQTRLERLLGLLMNDELRQLLAFKFNAAHRDEIPATPLDRLIALWRRIFPNNRVLVDNGTLLFAQTGSADTYSQRRLSHGERAVLYYGAAMLYAPAGSVVFVDSPEMFLHPTTIQTLWNAIEEMRPDCSMVYITHDLEFAASSSDSNIIWVRSCDTAAEAWDYRILAPQETMDDQLYLAILGERRPVLFIEGVQRSIDARLYPLIFPDKSVRPLGSCNKVIESTRTFNDLSALHHLSACGIVDRDRRDQAEVAYLRGKNIMVPEVAEIENMLLLPDVVRAVARHCGKNPDKVFASVSKSVIAMFTHDVRQQAMLHTRHRVKRTMEYRVDGRFPDINALERHLADLLKEIDARNLYEGFCRSFRKYIKDNDYQSILRVYNQKSMLPGCNVAGLCGLHNKEEYIERILDILRGETASAHAIRAAVRTALQAI